MQAGKQLDWVFAYGSNMDVDDLCRWLGDRGHPAPRVERVEAAVLSGYRLVWNYRSGARRGGAANVEPAEGVELPGLALEVDPPTLAGIDLKEGHPHRYRRGPRRVPVRLASGEHQRVWLYVVLPEFRQSGFVAPRRAYLELLLRAAERHAFPDWYVSELRATTTID